MIHHYLISNTNSNLNQMKHNISLPLLLTIINQYWPVLTIINHH